MEKKRDISIDILKFFAVLLIINSHAEICYPKYQALATGGAIGDSLSLFASGYTLFFKDLTSQFGNWYKRRINRIYPSVFACIIVLQLSGKITISHLSRAIVVGGEFIMAIMIYYVFALDYEWKKIFSI